MQHTHARTWITGASGFVGRSLVREAAAAGHRVLASDISCRAHPSTRQGTVEWVASDVRDPRSLHEAVHEKNIDTLIHAAAVTNGPTQELLETNIIGTLHVLEQAALSGISRMVFLSSGAVYDVTDLDQAVDERSSLGGDGDYALSKISGELLFRHASQRTGASFTCCRLGTLYGPEERETPHRSKLSIPSRLAASRRSGAPLKVAGLGRRRPYTHVDDAARAVVALANQHELEQTAFNIEGGTRLSLRELLEAAADVWPGFRWELTEDEDAAGLVLGPEDERARLDGSRLERAIGTVRWRAIADGLRTYLGPGTEE